MLTTLHSCVYQRLYVSYVLVGLSICSMHSEDSMTLTVHHRCIVSYM